MTIGGARMTAGSLPPSDAAGKPGDARTKRRRATLLRRSKSRLTGPRAAAHIGRARGDGPRRRWAMFDEWKKGFDAWEQATARLFETWMKSPLVLEPSGAMLTAVMRMKKASDDALRSWWGALGVATKRDQERTLYEVQRLHSRLTDLEERLEDLGAAREPAAPPHPDDAPERGLDA